MSNRVLGFLILFIFVGGIYLFYWYFFVYNLINITILSNVSEYKVELKSEKLKQTSVVLCPEIECKINDVSPFAYSVLISKDDYVSYETQVTLGSEKEYSLEVVLEKEVRLKKQDKIIEEEISSSEKIEQLKKKKSNYAYFILDDTREFSFLKEGKSMDLYVGDIKIGSFHIVEKNNISLQEVYGTQDYIFMSLSGKKRLVNIQNKKSYDIDLELDIQYVKTGNSPSSFQFVTDKGSFLYDKKTKEIPYFHFFDDFVYSEDSYIGIVKKSDERRLKNLGYEDEKENLVVYYNSETKERKILFRTNLDIKKIYKSDGDIFIQDVKEGVYKLENY